MCAVWNGRVVAGDCDSSGFHRHGSNKNGSGRSVPLSLREVSDDAGVRRGRSGVGVDMSASKLMQAGRDLCGQQPDDEHGGEDAHDPGES